MRTCAASLPNSGQRLTMMRVLFNATALRVPLAGVGQYTLRLAQALQALGTVDLDFFDGDVFSPKLRCDPSPRRAGVYAFARSALPAAYGLRRWLLQRRFDQGRAGHDLYHEPATLPLAFAGPTVLTVHDLSWIRHPQAHPAARVRDLERHFARGLAGASRVVTGAEFIKQEIVATFGTLAERIEVIPHGCDPALRPLDAAGTLAVRERHGLEHANYFLCVGTLEPRKNVGLAIEAHAGLPADVRQRHPLVLVGMEGWGNALPASARQGQGRGELRLLGYLPRGQLAILIAGALALVYPSRYEGFGLPPLEAMRCGVPPITSNSSALPEVVGDAGLMVDPDDVAGMREAMLTMASDAAFRQECSRRSIARAAPFSWERSAAATAAVYERAVEGG
jgi:glycosyltransferase involved in cell wall biosynthesis